MLRRPRRQSALAGATLAGCCTAGLSIAQQPAPIPAATAAAAQVAWKYAPEGASFDEVLAVDGVVFALDRSGTIHALDAASGDVKWRSEGKLALHFGFGMALSQRPGFDALLVGCDTGLLALERNTGKKLWQTDIAAGVAGPACTQEVVVAGSADGTIYACRITTGALLWKSDYLEDCPDDPPGFASERARFDGKAARPGAAATDGSMVVIPVFDQCRAVAIDASSGKRLWDFRTQGWMYGRPAFGPHYVYVGSQDQHVYAVDKEMGKEMWQVATQDRNEAAAAASGRFVYFGSCDGNLYAVDQAVGRVAWKFAIEPGEQGGTPIYSRPLVTGDEVALAAMPGVVYCLDRHTGKLHWQLRPSPKSELNSDLVALGGRLFVTTRKTDAGGESAVFAIDRP